MPLQYQPFVSLYTDPGIKEISQDLKTRYYENLKAKDALAKSLDDMVALSPDEETKNKFRKFRDLYLNEFTNHQVFSVDGTDIKWDLWNDHFIEYYSEVNLYIDNI
jgi:hypothetical protein